MTICRECHREGNHLLSCSHVRYEGRLEVAPTDEVVPDHEPQIPYCPGAEVACYYGDTSDSTTCSFTGAECYYRREKD